MTTAQIDRTTIARKRAEAESLELQARRLRQEASEIERNLLFRSFQNLDSLSADHAVRLGA